MSFATSSRRSCSKASSSRLVAAVNAGRAATSSTNWAAEGSSRHISTTVSSSKRISHNASIAPIPAFLLPSAQRYFSSTPTFSRPRTASASSSSSSKPDFAFPTKSSPTPYEIFHFPSRSVTPAEVKGRYYDLVRSLHPDRLSSSDKSKAEEDFKQVISAYNLLKDPRKKHLYDRAGLGWGPNVSLSSLSCSNPWKWEDRRYTRSYSPGFSGPGHDRFGWQHQGFYSNQFSHSAGWNGSGRYTSNGIFFSSIFLLTWLLAGVQYSRLSLQSQKAVERADKHHLDAARSLNEAREQARSEEGRERWRAFRRRAREQKILEELEGAGGHFLAIEAPQEFRENAYGVGHGGPSGREAAQARWKAAEAQARTKSQQQQ